MQIIMLGTFHKTRYAESSFVILFFYNLSHVCYMKNPFAKFDNEKVEMHGHQLFLIFNNT